VSIGSRGSTSTETREVDARRVPSQDLGTGRKPRRSFDVILLGCRLYESAGNPERLQVVGRAVTG
jgi:hypothetical protein